MERRGTCKAAGTEYECLGKYTAPVSIPDGVQAIT